MLRYSLKAPIISFVFLGPLINLFFKFFFIFLMFHFSNDIPEVGYNLDFYVEASNSSTQT
jgi:hypothetical protein